MTRGDSEIIIVHWVRLDKVILSDKKYTGKNYGNGVSIVTSIITEEGDERVDNVLTFLLFKIF